MNGSFVFLAHFDAFSGLNLICDCRTDLAFTKTCCNKDISMFNSP